jgi:hypothetical protein
MSSFTRQPTPDFAFLQPDGTTLHVSQFGARPLVLIFLRHLG